MRKSLLSVGEPAPWFDARCTCNPRFHFDTVGGFPIVLSFFQSASRADSQRVLADFQRRQPVFDKMRALFFGVSVDPDDEAQGRCVASDPGMRLFWDFDFAVSSLYGAVTQPNPSRVSGEGYRCFTVVLDQRLRVFDVVPFDNIETHVERVMRSAHVLEDFESYTHGRPQAPVLIVPRIFEPELCRRLIEYYEQLGGEESGFMREIDGKTVGVYDYDHKRRRDQEILDDSLRRHCMIRIHDRLSPEIEKAYQFKATRMERYIVACYEAETQGHFNRHRDNTTSGTAHRKFAVSLNLNTGEYEGGQVWFPEFGRQLFTPPAGGAVVFSCSLLHEAVPVTKGKRFVFLPFLYDDAAAQLRGQNEQFVAATINTPDDAAQGRSAPLA